MDLEIKKEVNGTTLTMSLSGALNKITVSVFDKEFSAASTGMKNVILDFSGVFYMSSAGLRSLLQASKQMEQQDGTLTVFHPQPSVMDVFEMTNFMRFIHIVREGEEPEVEAPATLEYYPLRPIQRWMTDTHFKKAKSTMMNTGALVRLDPAVDLERLADAVNGVLSAYDIFRCRLVFHPETGELCQRFDGEVAKIYVESLSEEAFEKRRQELRQPYGLIDRPLHRIHIIKTPSSQHLYMDFYHIIMDGAAIVLLFWREVEKRYVHGNDSPKTGKRQAASYAEYILEESRIGEDELKDARTYWLDMLKGFDKKLHLPPMDGGNPADGVGHEMETPIHNIEKSFFKDKKYSENTFFMAAAMLAITSLSGGKESILSWVHNGRVTSAERRLMGLMLDQFPIRWDFDRDISVDEFLQGLEARTVEGMKYRKGMDVVYEEGLEQGCACFILQKGSMGRRGVAKLGDTQVVIEEMPANEISAAENTLDIELNAHDDGTYSLVLDYDPSCYSRHAMEEFTRRFDEMTRKMQEGSQMLSEVRNGGTQAV